MAQENNGTVNKTKGKAAITFLIVIGSCCILQFFVIGIVNIIRGYSIATYLPFSILMVGFIIFGIGLPPIYRKKQAISSFFSITASIVMIYVCVLGISHGRYLKEAKGYYDACQYQQALQACEKEAQTWYHLLRYNYPERTAMNLMAETYCQLEDFNSARDIYKLMIDRYAGEFYGDRAQESLRKLEKGLKIIAYYPDRIAESPLPDFIKEETAAHLDSKHIEAMVLYDIARMYIYNLNCHAKAFEVYTRIIDMDVSEEMKDSARGQILKLRVADDKSECLNKMLIFGETHLRHLVSEYMEHYHTERPHQGIGNEIINPLPLGDGEIVCHERLGGLLKSYRRAA